MPRKNSDQIHFPYICPHLVPHPDCQDNMICDARRRLKGTVFRQENYCLSGGTKRHSSSKRCEYYPLDSLPIDEEALKRIDSGAIDKLYTYVEKRLPVSRFDTVPMTDCYLWRVYIVIQPEERVRRGQQKDFSGLSYSAFDLLEKYLLQKNLIEESCFID